MAESEEKPQIGLGNLIHFVNHDEIYRVIEDYTESDNPMQYKLENIRNAKDTITVGKVQVEQNLGKRWKIINLTNVTNN
jgi:hypothetical protein